MKGVVEKMSAFLEMGMGSIGGGQAALSPALLGSLSLFGGMRTTESGIAVPSTALITPDDFSSTQNPGAFDAGITPQGNPMLVDGERPLLFLPANAALEDELLESTGSGAIMLQDGTIAIAGEDSGIHTGLIETPPAHFLTDPMRYATSLEMAFAAQLTQGGDCGCKAGQGGCSPPGTPPTRTGGGSGGGNGKRIDSESYWKVLTQGGPMFAAAGGDFARTISTAATLYAAGTYADDPLGTQDPESLMSIPMQAFVPGGHFGKELDMERKESLDMLGAEYAQFYFWGKMFKYVASLGGNVAAMHRIAIDPALSEDVREDLAKRNYYDWLGNFAFLIEKGCYAATLGAVGMAQYAGRESALWDVGYIGGALILNSALALATVAWYGKVKCGLSMLKCEKDRFMTAHAEEENYDIDTASVNVAFFNFSNALPRVMKHFTAHLTTIALGAYLYAPQLFSELGENEYIQTAVGKLGDGTPAEHLYRWSNFGFIVPKPLVFLGLSLAVLAPTFGLVVSAGKLRRDVGEHKALKGKDTAEMISIHTGGKSPSLVSVGDRIRRLKVEHIANSIGVGGALCVFGTGFAVSYPATEPHALFLTAMYGSFIFLQYSIREWSTIASMMKAAPSAAWNYIANYGKNRQARIDKKAAEGGFLKKMWQSVREIRTVIKTARVARKADLKKMSMAERWRARYNNFVETKREWGTFFKTYLKQKKVKKVKKT